MINKLIYICSIDVGKLKEYLFSAVKNIFSYKQMRMLVRVGFLVLFGAHLIS